MWEWRWWRWWCWRRRWSCVVFLWCVVCVVCRVACGVWRFNATKLTCFAFHDLCVCVVCVCVRVCVRVCVYRQCCVCCVCAIHLFLFLPEVHGDLLTVSIKISRRHHRLRKNFPKHCKILFNKNNGNDMM